MNIALLDVDGKLPNLALMKLSAYHKAQGDTVEWYNSFDEYDILYMSKIFSFSQDYEYTITNAKQIVRGGTGYDISTKLPKEIDRLQPDYSIYASHDQNTAIGFLTRGCVRKCKWCVVPKKEGAIHAYMTIDEITQDGKYKKAILMDNNILAAGDYGTQQLQRIAELGIKVDFNQGLDARLVTETNAKLLAKIKWMKYIRLACDTQKQIAECERAMTLLSAAGYKGGFFLYAILLDDMEETYARVTYWKNSRFTGRLKVFAQPYRDPNTTQQVIPNWQKYLAIWCNKVMLYKTTDFEHFEYIKGHKGIELLTPELQYKYYNFIDI